MTRPIQSESIDKILPKLFSVRSALSGVKKGKTNPAFRSKYADLEAVIDTVQPEFITEKLLFSQPISAGPTDSTITLHTIVYDTESSQYMGSAMTLPIPTDPQKFGGWITYGKRYSLLAFLGLPTEDDDGNLAAGRTTGATQPAGHGTSNGRTNGTQSKPAGGGGKEDRTYQKFVEDGAKHFGVPATTVHREMIGWAVANEYLSESYDSDDPRTIVRDLTSLYDGSPAVKKQMQAVATTVMQNIVKERAATN